MKPFNDLSSAYVFKANLEGADLYRTDVYRTDLGRTNLEEINLNMLSEAGLRGAYFRAYSLLGSILIEADVRGIDLEGKEQKYGTI